MRDYLDAHDDFRRVNPNATLRQAVNFATSETSVSNNFRGYTTQALREFEQARLQRQKDVLNKKMVSLKKFLDDFNKGCVLEVERFAVILSPIRILKHRLESLESLDKQLEILRQEGAETNQGRIKMLEKKKERINKFLEENKDLVSSFKHFEEVMSTERVGVLRRHFPRTAQEYLSRHTVTLDGNYNRFALMSTVAAINRASHKLAQEKLERSFDGIDSRSYSRPTLQLNKGAKASLGQGTASASKLGRSMSMG